MAKDVYEATAVSAEDMIEGTLDELYKELSDLIEHYPQLSKLQDRSLREKGYFRYNKQVGSTKLNKRASKFDSHEKAHMAATDCEITVTVRFPAEDHDEEPFQRFPDVEKKTKNGTLQIWTEVMAADTDQARGFRHKVQGMIRGRMETLKRDIGKL